MSATGRRDIRLKDDFYRTPPWTFEWFEEMLDLYVPTNRGPSTILEPGAGVGGLVREMHRVWPDATIVAVEKRPECREMLYEAGAEHVVIGDIEDKEVQAQMQGLGPYELVLGNPPYGGPKYIKGVGQNPHYELWLRFVRICLGMTEKWSRLAFLLRTGVLEGADRNEWVRTHVPDVHVLPKRPKFTGTGNDSATYAWMVWRDQENDRGTVTVLRHQGDVDKRTGRTVR